MNHDERDGWRAAGPDGEVTREWRQASVEQPPSSIDAALIAAARKAVDHEPAAVGDTTPADRSHLAHGAGPQSRRHAARSPLRTWMKWQPLAAAAAVAAIAFMLVPLLPRDHPLAPPERPSAAALPQSDATAERRATPDESANQGALTTPSAQQSADAVAPRASPPAPPESVERRAIPQSRSQDVPAPAAVDGQPPKESDARPSIRLLGSQPPTTTSAPMAAKAAAGEMQKAATTDDANQPESHDPATWIAKITTLHAAGDESGAAATLRAFRTAYPDADARLPASLRAWAETVR